MKRFLTSLSVVIMLCLVCISCKKDDPVSYPAAVDGLWAGGNGSTGYNCDVLFTTDASTGPMCVINLLAPGDSITTTFEGRFTYDQSTGKATFTSEMYGAPAATFQYDEAGKILSASIASASVNYGTYTLEKSTYPASISGVWTGEAQGMKVVATLGSFAINGGIPAEVVYTIKNEASTVKGTYVYDNGTGAMKANIIGISANVQFKYNASTNMLDGSFAGVEISLYRIATAN